MAKIKGIKKLNSSMTKVFKPFGIKKVFCTDEYSYIRGKDLITFTILESSINDIWFLEFIEETFNYIPMNVFIMSMLHELGHHNTDDFLSVNEDEYCENEKQRINEEMQNANDEYSKVLEWQYFNLPDEKLATQWAVQYAKTHPKKVKQMWNKCYKALYRFYKINGIFEEIA